MEVDTSKFKFYSKEGIAQCKELCKGLLPYDPHDYSLEAATRSLDGEEYELEEGKKGSKGVRKFARPELLGALIVVVSVLAKGA